MKVLKFGAVWCPGCIMMKPIWQDIEKENSWLEAEYYDADENKELVEKYKIEKLPTFVFIGKDDQEICRFAGEISKKKLVEAILENKDK